MNESKILEVWKVFRLLCETDQMMYGLVLYRDGSGHLETPFLHESITSWANLTEACSKLSAS